MVTNENLIPVPGRLHSVASEGHVAGADEIYDDTQGKLQSAINTEVAGKYTKPSEGIPVSDLAGVGSANGLASLDSSGKVPSGQLPAIDTFPDQTGQSGKFLQTDGSNVSWQSVETSTVDQTYSASSTNAQSGTAVAGAISGKANTSDVNASLALKANTADVYTKSQIDNQYYTVAEGEQLESDVQSAITAQDAEIDRRMDQQDAIISTLNGQDVIVVSSVPASGVANKIYRVYGTTSYSDYMFNANALTTPIKIAEYDGNGELLDRLEGKELVSYYYEGTGYYKDNGELVTNSFWSHTSPIDINELLGSYVNIPNSALNILLIDNEDIIISTGKDGYPYRLGWGVFESLKKKYPTASKARIQYNTNNVSNVWCIKGGLDYEKLYDEKVAENLKDGSLEIQETFLRFEEIPYISGIGRINQKDYWYGNIFEDCTAYGIVIDLLEDDVITFGLGNVTTCTVSPLETKTVSSGRSYVFLENPVVINQNQQLMISLSKANNMYSTYSKYGYNGMYMSNEMVKYSGFMGYYLIGGTESPLLNELWNRSGKANISSSNSVGIKDAQSVLVCGSSLSDCAYQHKGASWPEKLNDMVDLNLMNISGSGASLTFILKKILDGGYLKGTTLTTKDVHPSYLLAINSSNNSVHTSGGVMTLRTAKEIADSFGAKLLVSTEELNFSTTEAFVRSYGSFCEEENIPFCPIGRLWRKCYPAGDGTHYRGPYQGWLGLGHSGMRMQGPYFRLYDLLSRIPISKSVKMFKVRPMYKNGSPAISDLAYDDNMQRLKIFTAVSCGAADNCLTSFTDNLDTLDTSGTWSVQYATGEGENVGVSSCETGKMIVGSTINFDNVCLIEFIIDKVQITKCKISFNCSVQPTVYIAKTRGTASQVTVSTEQTTITTFEQTECNLIEGVYTCDIAATDYDIELYDKVRVLIVYSGSFSVSDPVIYDYDGIDKQVSSLDYSERKYGTELNDKTSCESGWTLSTNATVKSFPAQIANYTGYNEVASHVEMASNGSSMTKTISIPANSNKVAVRIVCQSFIPIQTTRFDGTEIEDSPYINNSEVLYKNYEYDYGGLRLTVNDDYVVDRLVYPGWSEVYIEVPVIETDTSLTLKIEKHCIAEASYLNSDRPLIVHDVSVQKIA